MKPIPIEIGQLQFTIVRDKSGLNRMAPKYLLRLSMNSQMLVMKAINIFESATSHYKIQVIPKNEKLGLSMISHSNNSGGNEDETYLGRLRSVFGYSSWFLYDIGANPKEKNSAGKTMRRQLSTVLYSDKDKLGKKVPKSMEVYVP